MAQLAIAWTLRNPIITSALIGASKPQQIEDVVGALDNLELSQEELGAIEEILAS
jgi:L-glyceraldehyde 3-phosphate reductase